VFGLDGSTFSQDERILHGVFQLPHVSWIGIGQQYFHGLGRDGFDVFSHSFVELPDEVLDEQRDVISAITKTWKLNPNYIEAIVEILTKFSLADHSMEVPMGRRDDPDVRSEALGGAEGLVFSVFQHPKQLALYFQREISDLVQEERSPFGQSEPPWFVAFGVCEGSSCVAEQFAFKEGIRNSAAIDRDVRTVPSGAEVVDGQSQKLFPCAAFSLNEDGGIALCNVPKGAQNPDHLAVLSDDVLKGIALVEVLLEAFEMGQIAKCLHGPEDLTVDIVYQRGADTDGDDLSLLGHDLHLQIYDVLTRLKGLPQWTAVSQTAVGFKNVVAGPAEDLLFLVAGNMLCGPIEPEDASIEVHGEEAVGDMVQDGPTWSRAPLIHADQGGLDIHLPQHQASFFVMDGTLHSGGGQPRYGILGLLWLAQDK